MGVEAWPELLMRLPLERLGYRVPTRCGTGQLEWRETGDAWIPLRDSLQGFGVDIVVQRSARQWSQLVDMPSVSELVARRAVHGSIPQQIIQSYLSDTREPMALDLMMSLNSCSVYGDRYAPCNIASASLS